MQKPSSALAEIAVPLALALFVVGEVLGNGLPELRHDWRWPGDDGMPGLIASWTSGWLPFGIGEGNPYPTFYLVGLALSPFAGLLTPLAVAAGVVAVAVFVIARAAMRLAASFGAGLTARSATALVAVLNPWVYSKEIAGHVFMIADYGIVLALAAEMRRPAPRRLALAALCCFLVMQIQFALALAVPLVAWLVTRKYYTALAFFVCAAAPIAIGLAFESDALAGIPYNLVWQRAQSIPLDRVVVLQGYFTYAGVFEADAAGTAGLVAIAIAGAVAAVRTSILARTVAAGTALLLVIVAGTEGPIGPLYAWTVTHVRASGVFRELYDLAGLIAAAYVAGAASACRLKLATWPLLAIGLSFWVAWLAVPPRTWFVPASEVRVTPVSSPDGERVAFFPAFQPLSLHGRGSGYDPDLYVRTSRATPLNEFYPTFPVDAALTRAERSGDVEPLGWYGVSEIRYRPQYRSDRRSLSFQRDEPLASHGGATPPLGRRVDRTLSLLSFAPGAPAVAAIGGDLDERSVSAADAGRFAPVLYEPSLVTLDSSAAWVDLRLAVADLPDAQNAFGGVVTRGSGALDVRGARALLAYVGSGVLHAGTATLGPTGALTWWTLPAGTARVTCAGVCAVAAGASEIPLGPAHVASPPSVGVPLRPVTPWLAVAELPPLAGGTLRYNVRYDGSWTALAGTAVLPHVRLDTSVNGFVLPPSATRQRLVIVEWAAAVMYVCELAVALGLVAACAAAAMPSLRRKLARTGATGAASAPGRT